MREDPIVEKQPKFSTLVTEDLQDPYIAGQVLETYESLFDDQAKPTAQLQRCHSREDLESLLKDPAYIKFLSLSSTNELLACCIVATRPEDIKVAYANPARYQMELEPGEKLWYVTALFAAKKMGNSTSRLLEVLAERVLSEKVVLGYDHSESNAALPQMIDHVTSQYLEKSDPGKVTLEDKEVGRQTFRAIRLRANG